MVAGMIARTFIDFVGCPGQRPSHRQRRRGRTFPNLHLIGQVLFTVHAHSTRKQYQLVLQGARQVGLLCLALISEGCVSEACQRG